MEALSEAPLTADLPQTLTRLRSDLENVQRELDQALGVWRNALIAEKKEFQSLLQAKQLAWNEQESEWQRQRLAYEQEIQELESFFKTELAAREQHGVQALNELDDSWQRDKLLWDQAATRRVKELEQREALWRAENQKQESRIQELQEKIARLESEERTASSPSAASEKIAREWTETTVRSLEHQVTTLDTMIRLLIPRSPHPLRRKTDRS